MSADLVRVTFVGQMAALAPGQARRIVRSQGGETAAVVNRRTSLVVVGRASWPLAPDGRLVAPLIRAHELRREVIDESAFLGRIGQSHLASRLTATMSIDELSRALDIPAEALDRCAYAKLIDSINGRISLAGTLRLRSLAAVLRSRGNVGNVLSSFRQLNGLLPDAEAAIRQLHALTALPDLVEILARSNFVADRQLRLEFPAGDEPEPIILRLSLRENEHDPGPEGWFELGQALEERGELERAADAYRRAIVGGHASAEYYFNLGSVLYAAGDAGAAVESYRLAVAREPRFAAAWFNLGDVLEAAGKNAAAIVALEGALRADPTYGDAHFNLALLLEKTDQPAAAIPHWRSYLETDGNSDWANTAREHLQRASSVS